MSKPIIVIRKLEDSPEWLDRRLVTAYIHTIYSTSHVRGGMTLRLYPGQSLPQQLEDFLEEQNCNTCAIITAWNPGSVTQTVSQNTRNNRKLEADLRKVSALVLPGSNIDPDNRWPSEESFFAFGIFAENAVQLGRKYGQNAIVWLEKSRQPELWWLL